MTEETNKNEETLLSVEQVFDVIQFAKSMIRGLGIYPAAITPQLLNSAMKNISFAPAEMTETDLTNALKNPKESEKELRQFMEYLEVVSMPIKRMVTYMASHLAFDLTWTVSGEMEDSDYTSRNFLRDKAKMYEFLDDFNWHFYFKNALRQLIRNEVYVFSVRDDGDKIVLQELPIDRCKITGRHDYGFLISFDFSYFLQVGIDIRLYPKWFREQFAKMFTGENIDATYLPKLNPGARGGYGSHFAYWVDVPPDVAWVFKLDSSITAAVPYMSGIMPEFVMQPTIRALQKDINMATAARLLVGQVPMRDSKTNVKDMIAIDPDTLGKFMSLLASSLPDAINLAVAPLDDMKSIQYKAENTVYNDYLSTSMASSGLDTNLFFTSGLKANTVETMLSHESDGKILEVLYEQFNLFMEYHINKYVKESVTRGKTYRFIPRFEGNDYYLDRERRYKKSTELATIGIVLPQKIAASQGMKPQELERMMQEARASGFVDNLTPITPSYATPKTGAGRPQSSDSELSDSAAQTREDGGNIAKGGNI